MALAKVPIKDYEATKSAGNPKKPDNHANVAA
jgi:hypothetical protein